MNGFGVNSSLVASHLEATGRDASRRQLAAGLHRRARTVRAPLRPAVRRRLGLVLVEAGVHLLATAKVSPAP